MSIVREKVCANCEHIGIVHMDCVCAWKSGYPMIELEFEKCDHCGNIEDSPLDNEFNDKQRKEHSKKEE